MKQLCFAFMMLIALTASAAGIRQLIDSLKPAPVQPAPQPKPPAPPNSPVKK